MGDKGICRSASYIFASLNLELGIKIVAIWPVTSQGFQNTKWPAVVCSQ